MSYTIFNDKLFIFIARKYINIGGGGGGELSVFMLVGSPKVEKMFSSFGMTVFADVLFMISTLGNFDRRSVKTNKYSPVGIGRMKLIKTVSHTASVNLVIFGGAGACCFVTD